MSSSSTSNSINKLLNNKADINTSKNTSLTNELPFSPSLPQTPSQYKKRQYTSTSPSYSPPHPSITPPSPIPSFPIPCSTPPSSPTQITHFPIINNDSPTEHPNSHHPSLPLHSTLNNSSFPPTTMGVPNLASTPPSPISTQGVSTGTGIIAFFKVRTGFLLSNPIPYPCTLAYLSVDTP